MPSRLGSAGKVQDRHVDRLAVVYVRQSSRQQVLDHGESTRLQYGLAERAVALGWPRGRVLVIDEDLGRSGVSAQDRPGFQRLVAEITLDHVGLVLGIEMSRLARAGRDWHQLIELCSLARTLLADVDGVYDPNEYNDRLLLGLKGTMSEVELHLMKQRMASGRLAKAGRGELAVPLPAGYVRRPSGEVTFDPDEQVQAVVRLVFHLFEEFGTIHAVLRCLVEHQVRIGMRERSGEAKGEVVWRRPHQSGLQNMLRNPAYAGIYTYGKSYLDHSRKVPGQPESGRVRAPADQWLVTIPGLLPAYISLEQYERNLARMRANRQRAETLGAPRNGPALLAGLVVCEHCRQRMGVGYERSRAGLVHRYVCQRQHLSYGTGRCQQMAGAFLDDFVVAQVLAALAPAGLELSLRAAEQIQARRQEIDQIWRQRLERAELACDRARRQYQLAEPENRLVVRQLEADWEAALAAHQQLREDYQRHARTRPIGLSPSERDAIRALADDIPALWQAASTTDADRKQLLRCVVDQVRVKTEGTSEKVHTVLVWAGGSRTGAELRRPVARLDQLSYYPLLVERLRALAATGLTARAIAEVINAEGLRPPRRQERFNPDAIRQLMNRLGIRPSHPQPRADDTALGPDQWWLATLAREIGIPQATLFGWIKRGWISGHREPKPPRRWIISADHDKLEQLRALHHLAHGYHNRRRWTDALPPDHEGNSHDHATRTGHDPH